MTFVVKGLSEVYDPRGGYPIPFKDALVTGEAVYAGADAKIPAAGSEIKRVTDIAVAVGEGSRSARPLRAATLANRQLVSAVGVAALDLVERPFTVFEKTVSELQDAMTSGAVTSEDVTREYLARLSLYDRHGPTFRSVLPINPRAIADARARDAERAAGRVRSPFHGVPIVLKDNIDATELPTTGGSLALVDHRPRLDSRVAAGMKQGGAVILGKANLDEFPFGDFGISTVGGTVGNAYDPSLSTSGSSGGSATAVAASLAALGFGTDTCNSLSNPGGFASLATIRATRGLTSRAGVMPLNTYNDAVGPMAKSVRDVALALDLVTGSDPEDPVTARRREAHLRIVRGGPRHRDAERQAHRRVPAALCRFHRRARSRRQHGARDQGTAIRGRNRRRCRGPRLRREVCGGARRRAGIAARRVGRRTCRAARSPATRC